MYPPTSHLIYLPLDMPNAVGAVAPDPSYVPPTQQLPQQQVPQQPLSQQPPVDVDPSAPVSTSAPAPAPKGMLSARGRRLD